MGCISKCDKCHPGLSPMKIICDDYFPPGFPLIGLPTIMPASLPPPHYNPLLDLSGISMRDLCLSAEN